MNTLQCCSPVHSCCFGTFDLCSCSPHPLFPIAQAVHVLGLDQLKSVGSTLTSLHYSKGLTDTKSAVSDIQDDDNNPSAGIL